MEAWKSLERAYLDAGGPYGGSGFSGGPERWERCRRPIVDAVSRSGTFLDVGCADGALMRTLPLWTREKGVGIEPYGLEVSPRLADLARERMPGLADRVFVGDVASWLPPHRFDSVRTELVYVPAHRQRWLVERLLEIFVATRGRLILCSYGSRDSAPKPVAEPLRELGFAVAGEATGGDPDGTILTRVAWIDRPGELS